MAVESLTTRYSRLFDLHVLHHYWLDDGTTPFDALATTDQEQRLRDYDVRRFLELRPTGATRTQIEGLAGVWRATSLGLVVAVPAGRAVPDDAVFEFAARLADPAFVEYTAYGLTVRETVTAFLANGSMVRYRAEAALHSNLSGCARGSGATRQLFVSREVPMLDATDRVEYVANDSGALVQLVSDPPAATRVTLAAVVADAPACATHADVPAISPPTGIVGTVPARGIELPDGAPDDTFAMIRIAAVNPDDAEFSCTAGGMARTAPPVFQLRLRNRWTIWRRFAASSPSTPVSESGPFPLTSRGNPSTGPKPTTGPVKLDRTGTAIDAIVSEIYV